MSEFPEAGVGMIYLPGLENLMESQLHLLDIIEIEPQTLWYNRDTNCDSFIFNREQSEILRDYPCHKLFHSVGFPIGGTVLPGLPELKLLKEHAALVRPIWISEHLSFNCFEENENSVNTNFLLPPLQTPEGIEVAVRSISHFRSKIPLPFVFETGVNYLKPRRGEIPDGQFVAEIAELADCSILLDLHNIMTNQLNGRQSIDEFVSQIPLDRVCEIHIAGGFFHNGYYIDGHSGVSSHELLEILEKLVLKLKHLKALVFEMLPEYVKDSTEKDLNIQLEKMHRIWDKRGKTASPVKKFEKKIDLVANDNLISVRDWEYTLGKIVIDQQFPETSLSQELSRDGGIPIMKELVFHFRASVLVSTLKYTCRLLKLSLGIDRFNENIKTFFAQSEPEMLSFAVAKKYASYLRALQLPISYLEGLISYEMASLETLVDNKDRSVPFNFNPFPVFRSLAKNELPEDQETEMNFVLDIRPDEHVQASEALVYSSVFHN